MTLWARAGNASRLAAGTAVLLGLVAISTGWIVGIPWPQVCAYLDTGLFLLGALSLVTGLLFGKPRPPARPEASEAKAQECPPNPEAASEAQVWTSWKARSLELVAGGLVLMLSTQVLFLVRIPLGRLYGWEPPISPTASPQP